jgi:hypothetical protein
LRATRLSRLCTGNVEASDSAHGQPVRIQILDPAMDLDAGFHGASSPNVPAGQRDMLRSVAMVEDFFECDFFGAPIDAKYGEEYNGGLSLRNPALFLTITEEVDFQSSGAEFEDQWFYSEAKKLVAQGVTLPTKEVAERFSVETIYYDKPLGYHQPQRWQKAKMNDIKEWCPEVGMLVGRRAV